MYTVREILSMKILKNNNQECDNKGKRKSKKINPKNINWKITEKTYMVHLIQWKRRKKCIWM